ncbi:MAG: monovalent cation/H+ antiporter complex subunit F [Myxococcales bacterium]
MNAWLVAASGLSLSLVPCALTCLRGGPVHRLVGLEMAGVCESLVLLLLAEGFQRPLFYDLGLALALLTFGGGMVFARFLERWL